MAGPCHVQGGKWHSRGGAPAGSARRGIALSDACYQRSRAATPSASDSGPAIAGSSSVTSAPVR